MEIELNGIPLRVYENGTIERYWLRWNKKQYTISFNHYFDDVVSLNPILDSLVFYTGLLRIVVCLRKNSLDPTYQNKADNKHSSFEQCYCLCKDD
jgi:hypothetical protein